MGVSYRFVGDVVLLTAEGDYARTDLSDTWLGAEQDPNYPEQPELCLDMRGSTSLARRSAGELRELADWFVTRAHMVGNRCALVARPGVQYGLMRMASTWVELKGIRAHVCCDPDEAVAWLTQTATASRSA